MTEETQTQVINWDVNKAKIAEVAEELKDIDAYVDLPAAKAAKKRLTKMRTALGDAHKETKAEALEFGRLCDAKKNEYLALIVAIEDPISDQLTEIKEKAANEEAERVQRLMNEIERIQAYTLDRHSLTLDELTERLDNLRTQEPSSDIVNSIDMDGSRWVDSWDLSKQEAELKLRLAIDREKTRIEEEAKSAAVEEENRALREQLAKAEDDAEAVRLKEQDERLERDREAQKIKDEEDRVAREKQATEDAEKQAEFDRVAKEQEEEREKLDKEREEREAEEKKVADEAERVAEEKRKADQAPDADKLLALAAAIAGIELPELTSDLGNEILFETRSALTELVYDIREKTEGLK